MPDALLSFPGQRWALPPQNLALHLGSDRSMNAAGSAVPLARLLVLGALLATTTGCVCIVRSLEIAHVEPAQLATLLASASDASANAGPKQTIKLQYVDGTSILFRSGVRLEGDSLVGDGLRAAPDVLGLPRTVRRFPTAGLVGGVLFRERTNAGASVGASVAGTAAAALVLGFIAAGLGDAMDRAAAEALGCALGGTCSIANGWDPRFAPTSRARGPALRRSIQPAGRTPR